MLACCLARISAALSPGAGLSFSISSRIGGARSSTGTPWTDELAPQEGNALPVVGLDRAPIGGLETGVAEADAHRHRRIAVA